MTRTTTRWRSFECTATWRVTRMPRGIIKFFPISIWSEETFLPIIILNPLHYFRDLGLHWVFATKSHIITGSREPWCGELPDLVRHQGAGPGHEGLRRGGGVHMSKCILSYLLQYNRFFLTNQRQSFTFVFDTSGSPGLSNGKRSCQV